MERELLASLIEVVDHGNRVFEAAHSKKGARLRPAVRIDRPWDKRTPRRRQSTAEEVRAFLSV